MSDDIVEGDESFMLTIKHQSLPGKVSAGDFDRTTINIEDNDG